jgi:triacylglycerol lipase
MSINIILAHGILGFRQRFGIEYFRGVAGHLRQAGARVLVPEVSATGGIQVRGNALRAQVLLAFADGTFEPGTKAHIIAHSMGGLDSRYILSPKNERTTPANDLSSRIASLTTVSSPHHGSPIADLLAAKPVEGTPTFTHLRRITGGLAAAEERVRQMLNHVGMSVEGLHALTTNSMQEFNGRYPDHPEVAYFSVAGVGRAGPRPTALILRPLHHYILSHTGELNDAMVTLSSARWGDFDPNTWPCDHLDEVGHDLDRPFAAARFNYLERYDGIVRRVSNHFG